MTGRIILTLCAAVTLVGCSDDSQNASEDADVEIETPFTRSLVAQIVDLRIEPTAAGAIIRATGLPTRQGHFGGELVRVSEQDAEEGVLRYEFLLTAPFEETRSGPRQSREILVARFVPARELAEVTAVEVSSASNTQSVSP